MLLNKGTQYALIMLKEITGKTTPTRLCDIANKHDLPEDFLQQINRKLRDSGIVESKRGRKGGISRATEYTTMKTLLTTLQGEPKNYIEHIMINSLENVRV